MLVKQVEAKEFLLVEELESLVKVKKELTNTKLLLEKFNTSNNQHDEILVVRKRDLERGGITKGTYSFCN